MQLTNLRWINLAKVQSPALFTPVPLQIWGGYPCRGQRGPGAAAGLAPLLETAPPVSSSLSHGNIRERKEGKEVKKKKVTG